ncbi:MAG: Nitrogen regulatory protein P-II, GlnK, partial [uncultured Craurococcus sp.]
EAGDGVHQALQAGRGARSAHPARSAGPDGDRSEGLRPPEGADGNLPRGGVPGQFPSEDQDRGRRAGRAGGSGDGSRRQGRPHGQDRRRQDLRAGRGAGAPHPHRRDRQLGAL